MRNASLSACGITLKTPGFAVALGSWDQRLTPGNGRGSPGVRRVARGRAVLVRYLRFEAQRDNAAAA
jgi:hypothetical protein